ncbi:Rieske (2Fe-2S) protein [Paenibacillus thermotolerans]|uniref:Rieske (2Fe-2S) protein n=1 Tax=Paenibacillus thermotolerans TaxID=3027807 RepID=UPI0023677C6B|nr:MULTISPECIES: non-heme iron oxygenase ferredoxin subunit [unclassified Paenibacillus]
MAWVQIANTRDIAAGEMKQIVFNEECLALFHVEDGYYVTSNLCTHRKQYLTDGSLDGEIVSCPRHGGKFDVKTGAPTAGPCYTPLPTYSVEIRNDEIWIDIDGSPEVK